MIGHEFWDRLWEDMKDFPNIKAMNLTKHEFLHIHWRLRKRWRENPLGS